VDGSTLVAIVSTSAFASALVFLLARALDVRRRRRQARGYLTGMQLEIVYAQECADFYITDVDGGHPVWAPNYRVITEFTRLHLPWLAAEGYVRSDESRELLRFYARASEFNRSLDALASLTSAPGFVVPDPPKGKTLAEIETRRAYAKSQNLLGRVAGQLVGSTTHAWTATTQSLNRLKHSLWRPW
jgi:hypothetical protein